MTTQAVVARVLMREDSPGYGTHEMQTRERIQKIERVEKAIEEMKVALRGLEDEIRRMK